MMKCVASAVALFCGCLLSAALGADTPTRLPDAGPENGGLRLRLVITQEREVSSNTVTVELQNVGPKTVVLVGEWDYQENRDGYQAFFEKRIGFVTYPEVQPDSFQTAGGERRSPQPQYELGAGKSLAISWKTKGNQIRQDGPFPGTTPVFPSVGLYGVRASIVVLTKDGRRILLVSNEQPFIVGGVSILPKYATAHVVSVNRDQNAGTIDLGSEQRIEKGDRFVIRWGLQASWRLTVTNVHTWGSDGSIAVVHHDGRPETPKLPPERSLATLEPNRGAPREE